MNSEIALHSNIYYPHNRLALPGRVQCRLRAGTDPETIASRRDVIAGACAASPRFDGGVLDSCIHHFTSSFQVTRPFDAAQNSMNTGKRHKDWDDVEIDIGLSRTFCIDMDQATNVNNVSDSLRQLAVVEMASPVYLTQTPFTMYSLSNTSYGRNGDFWHDRFYAFDMIGGGHALSIESGDPTIIVAVIDSGVAIYHPEFQVPDRLRKGFDMVDLSPAHSSESIELFGDLEARDRDPLDEMGHGTACAGIIGARGIQVPPGCAGVSPILPMRALAGARVLENNKLTAIGSGLDINAAFKRAVDLGAKVCNLSFGTPASALRDGDPIPHSEVVRYAQQRGCVLVAASGNSGDNTIYYPAALPGVIAVGAVGPDEYPAIFSTRGSHVALCAPGINIPSVSLSGYKMNSGTSFAAPFVAASAALILSRALKYAVPLSPSTVKNILISTTESFPAEVDSQGCGTGILNLPAALQMIDKELRLHFNQQTTDVSKELSLQTIK